VFFDLKNANIISLLMENDELKNYPWLSSKDAEAKLKKYGYNELPHEKPKTIIQLWVKVVSEPMFLLLIAASSVYFILGDRLEASILLFSILFIVTITFYQEHKTERTLETLRNMASPRALVIRDGQQYRIPGRDVVVGDVIILEEGARIPADAKILHCRNMTVDESLLTGESVPVIKRAWLEQDLVTKDVQPGGDSLPFVYSGTMLVLGHGIAEVVAIGEHTNIGKIGKSLESLTQENTPLQKEIGGMVLKFALWAVFLCVATMVLYGVVYQDILHGVLFGITLAMSLLPEEFPVVLTIFMALGAWRLSRKNVLTRRIPIIETLGATTVLCVDKTGTLTENKMEVALLSVDDLELDLLAPKLKVLPQEFHELTEYGFLASNRNPFDPMEKAIKGVVYKYLADSGRIHERWESVKEYPLSDKLFAMSHVWRSKQTEGYVISSKGAPEAIADLCDLTGEEEVNFQKKVEKLTSKGLRVLAVAKASLPYDQELPADHDALKFEILGLMGFEDPVRVEVRESVQLCYQAGVRVIMITGDYPGTALKIGQDIGLKNSGMLLTGTDIQHISVEELTEKVKTINIFARVIPEQKLKIVQALKANGEVVAMTGDGVNDAPALKAADVGVAMGMRGTDVAREAGDIVLMDDNFASIVKGVKMGRRIYDNIKKALIYIFALHIPIAGLAILPTLSGMPIMFFPVHIVLLELMIDPLSTVVFEAEKEEEGIMQRKPRGISERIFTHKTALIGVLQGVGVLIVSLFVYYFALNYFSAERARMLTFVTLVCANLSLALVSLSWSKPFLFVIKNHTKLLWVIAGVVLGVLAVSMYVPVVQELFEFGDPRLLDFPLAIGFGLLSVVWFEGYKYFSQKKERISIVAK